MPQTTRAQDCTPPPLRIDNSAENIFSPEQEMWLGEAIVERQQREYGVIDDRELLERLQQMMERISKHLPPTGIKYRVFISDLPDTNAFSFPGGYIMITRKMISFVRTEDELAWVMAHELGHSSVRHGAIDFTRYFKRILKVTSFSGRADLIEKYNELIDKANTKSLDRDDAHEDTQQLEADRSAMFAMAAAGYDITQVGAFWTRLTRARRMNAFQMFLSGGNEADKRLYETLGQIKSLPAACREPKPIRTDQTFDQWRTRVIAFNNHPTEDSVPGLQKRIMLAPLQSEIERLRFSRDGKYLLAQDSSTVTVLTVKPFRVLFQASAMDARPAEFSFDSKELVVVTRSLHVQKWDLEARELSAEIEIAVPGVLWQSRVSPNGDFVAAYTSDGDLVIQKVATSDEIFREKAFFSGDGFGRVFSGVMRDPTSGDVPIFKMDFSPDGRYFVAGHDAQGIGDTTLVVDLTSGKKVDVGSNVKGLLKHGFAFEDAGKMIGRTSDDIKDSGIFSFPEGKKLEAFELGGMSLTKPARGNTVVVRPVTGAAVGVFDTTQKKYVFAGKRSALDVYEDIVAAERKNGELALYKIGLAEPFDSVQMPKSEIGGVRTVAFSSGGGLLALSNSSRGAVWSLPAGEKVFELRSFQGSYISPDLKIYALFPEVGSQQRTVAKIDPLFSSVTPGNFLIEGNAQQAGKYLVFRTSSEPEKPRNKDRIERYSEEKRGPRVANENTKLDMRDATTGTRLWERAFPEETPTTSVNSRNSTITFVWDADSRAARRIAKNDPSLQARMDGLKDKLGDYLIEIDDAETGALKNYLVLETGEASFRLMGLTVSGDHILIVDDKNRTLVFSASTGELLRRFVGDRGSVSSAAGVIALENLPGRLTIYDLGSGKELTQLTFRKDISAMEFSPDGKQLRVLTSDQVVFLADTDKMIAK